MIQSMFRKTILAVVQLPDTGARETNDETISIIQVNKPEMSDRIGVVGK